VNAISNYVVVTHKFYKEKGRWIAYCEELGTSTFGRSLPEAKRRLEEAVVCHINTLEDVWERERFFRDYNIPVYPTRPTNKINISFPATSKREIFASPHIQQIPAGAGC
jgi:predicted RNase H-like HicB family nuclease